MAAPAIEVQGRRELERALRAAGERSGQLKEVHQRLGIPLAMAGRGEAPMRSGALGGTVRAAATQRALSLRAGSRTIPYAGPIHYGWPRRGISPDPFLIRARDAMRDQLLEGYRRHLDELVAKVGADSWHGR